MSPLRRRRTFWKEGIYRRVDAYEGAAPPVTLSKARALSQSDSGIQEGIQPRQVPSPPESWFIILQSPGDCI